MNRRRILVVAVSLAGLGAVAVPLAEAGVQRTITVSGTGIVTTVPNQAEFTFGVTTTGKSAQAALSANAARMTSVIAALKRLGLGPADLQTAEVSLNPNTNDNGTAVINYSASNSVNATTDNVARSGAIVDAAVGAGANLVSGPSLTPSDQLQLSRRALGAAILDAHARAAAAAAAAGVKLGEIEVVTETSSSTPPVLPEVARAATASTPVEPGTVQTEEDVTVTYAIA
jgi:uncharacterized protein YggE